MSNYFVKIFFPKPIQFYKKLIKASDKIQFIADITNYLNLWHFWNSACSIFQLFKFITYFEIVLVQFSKWNYLDNGTPKCQLYLSSKIVADKASRLSSFFSTSKQEERITCDHVRPSAASFNQREVY